MCLPSIFGAHFENMWCTRDEVDACTISIICAQTCLILCFFMEGERQAYGQTSWSGKCRFCIQYTVARRPYIPNFVLSFSYDFLSRAASSSTEFFCNGVPVHIKNTHFEHLFVDSTEYWFSCVLLHVEGGHFEHGVVVQSRTAISSTQCFFICLPVFAFFICISSLRHLFRSLFFDS